MASAFIRKMQVIGQRMWIYVPDTDERKEPWIGKISSDESPKSSWTFELIRHADLENMYQTSPFDKKGTVIGLLDHQRNCTLIRPLVHHIDPGSLGVRIGFQRTRIEGQFGALLTDLDGLARPLPSGGSCTEYSVSATFVRSGSSATRRAQGCRPRRRLGSRGASRSRRRSSVRPR